MASTPSARSRGATILLAAATIALVAPREAAADPPPEPQILAVAPAPDAAEPAKQADPWQYVRRPWLYAADPTAPPAGHVLTSLGVGIAQIDRGAARPFAANVAHAGAVFSAGAEVGIFKLASLHAEGLLAGDGGNVHGGAMLGASIYLLGPKSPVGVVVSGGYLRELGGANGVWGRASIAGDLGHLRLVLTGLGEHVFSTNDASGGLRDGIDLLITAGAAYRVTDAFQLGAEYVVQDLEGLWDPGEIDGGVRHFLGPTATLQLARHIQLGAGPSFGLSAAAPRVLGRMSASYAF
ncbi:MAG: hypothetical protein ABJE95_23085 [Byssovorax sp.]